MCEARWGSVIGESSHQHTAVAAALIFYDKRNSIKMAATLIEPAI